MKIAELFRAKHPVCSFEFFPPKTDEGFSNLYSTIADLKRLNPNYVSVTWGAGGSTRRKTIELVSQIQNEIGITAMAHFTCVGASRTDLAQSLDRMQEAGIANVLALSGDLPEGYVQPPDAFRYASELVAFIRTKWNFCLAGGCYPETHPAATSPEADLENLVRKVNQGLDFLITQLFFDNAVYFSFVERARAAGITIPIVPGIMPIVSEKGIRRMTQLCGASIPHELNARLAACAQDPVRIQELGIEWAAQQCQELLDRGAPGLHFYTLNQSSATRRIHAKLFGS